MIVKDNPYLIRKHELITAIEKEVDKDTLAKLQAELKDVEQKSREHTQNMLSNLQENVDSVREQKIAVQISQFSISKQYAEMCRVYKEADKLIKEIRQAKKEVRDEITTNRLAKKGVTDGSPTTN
jgi:hypothetical protein